MSFANAMAVVSVDPASGPSLSAAQVKAALVSKYGPTAGDAINAQFDQTATDSNNNCSGSAAAPSAAPTAGSPGTCTINATGGSPSRDVGVVVHRGLREPGRHRGERVAGAGPRGASERAAGPEHHLLGRQQNPDNLFLDGSQLAGDAQAALDPNYDPPPADNADWVTAMNDYVAAGEDYSNDNMNQQDDNPTQASAEITAGNAALASFNTANGGVLNGIIQSL